MKRLHLVILGVMLSLCCSVLYAISVCGSCGYENSDDARFCSHCGAKLVHTDSVGGDKGDQPATDSEHGSNRAVDMVSEATVKMSAIKEGSKSLVKLGVVKGEMRKANDYSKQGAWEMAELFAHNAQALNLLTAQKGRDARYQLIASFLEKCRRSAMHAKYVCPDCKGTGEAVMSGHLLNGNSLSMRAAGMRCRRCGGRGYILGSLTVDERKRRIGVAREKYRTQQQNSGKELVGLVWVPPAVVKQLDLRTRVALKRALPPLCPHCLGLGLMQCKKCKGRGTVVCRAKGCHDGYVEDRSQSGHLSDSGRHSSGSIGINRTGRHKCTVCHGTGLQTCKECSGTGSFVCKYCNGSGVAPICRKCSGEGIIACRHCAGSGKYRGKECPYCRGQGIVECPSCNGTGRRRR